MYLFTRTVVTAVLALSGSVVAVRPALAAKKTAAAAGTNSTGTLSAAAQSLFDFSMQAQDARWDDYFKFILYPSGAGELNTRFTAWYTAGLLHRNEGNDVENAKAALENVLAAQMVDDYDAAWYGTFKVTLDTPVPTPDSTYWPPEIYTTYDPNWREFIGTQLVQVVELYADLLGNDLVSRIEDAVEMAAVGGMRRNGSYPDGDNLILGYTNPQYMRCLLVGWIGARRNNQTMVDFANTHGDALVALFRANGSNTLGEYNAPTYYGMDIWALAANIAYGPAAASLTTHAAAILAELWDDIAAHYNPYLRNLVGPYDRAYTRDMTMHSAVLSLWWWGLWGRGTGGQAPLGDADLLYDAAQGAALALVMDTAAQHVSAETAAALTATGAWTGSRRLRRTIRGDLTGEEAASAWRVATSWVSAAVMMGAETTGDTANRGGQFVPAIVHWASDPAKTPSPYVGFFSLYPSAATIDAVADEGTLTVAYPNATQAGADIFTFAVSGLPPQWILAGNTVTGLEELPCLRVNVSAPGLEKLAVTASTSTLYDHYYYNVSYAVPAGFEGVPSIQLAVQYTC